jgi:hypothetical protein
MPRPETEDAPEEPRVITVLRQYLSDIEDRELYNIATLVLADQIKGLKMQIGVAVTNARLRLNMDNLKGSNEALGEARKLKAQYRFLKSEWEKVRPVDADDPDKQVSGEGEGVEPTSLTEKEMEALIEQIPQHVS